MGQKRITFPLEGFNVSGGIRIVIQVANALAAGGHRIRIVVPDYAAAPPFPLHDSITLVVQPTRGRAPVVRKVWYVMTLCLTSTKDSDVCFATGYRTPYYLCLSKWLRFSRARLFYLVQHYEPWSHATRGSRLSRAILEYVAQLGYRLPLKTIAVSDWVRDMIGDPNTTVIGNGVDLGIFRPSKRGRAANEVFTVGTIAGAAAWKGYRVFLDALRELPAGVTKSMRALIASAFVPVMPTGISGEFITPSNDNELVDFYRSCDVFVCSSFIEGFGLPALEAMACGVPVITTSCGGASHYANESNCLMVPPGDSKAIAAAIVRLRDNPTSRLVLRERGLETAERHSLDQMSQEYVGLFLSPGCGEGGHGRTALSQTQPNRRNVTGVGNSCGS